MWRHCSYDPTVRDIDIISAKIGMTYNEKINGYVDEENKVLYLLEHQDNETFGGIVSDRFETYYDTQVKGYDYKDYNYYEKHGRYNYRYYNTKGIEVHSVLSDKGREIFGDYNGYHIVSIEAYSDDWDVYYTTLVLDKYICGNEILFDKDTIYFDEENKRSYTNADRNDIQYKDFRVQVDC